MSNPPRLTEVAAALVKQQLSLGRHKSIGYLPLGTIVTVLGLSRSEFEALAVARGYSVASEEARSPIVAFGVRGSVHVYDNAALQMLLSEHVSDLENAGWPLDADSFVKRLATEWLNDGNPVMSIVRAAFGEVSRSG